ncbi:MAG TPA: GNAT family N-acetyltransferase [Myxococcales bacterium]|nr:GNAT family N-acetyltransferase [Myxococcales bacterium]
MFASVALASRIDAAEVDLTLQAGRLIGGHDTLAVEIAGGAAVSTARGSPFDKVIGLGFAPFEDAALSAFVAFEEAVLARGGVVQVELSSLADPSVARALARRGYTLVGFENVLGFDLGSAAARRAEAADTPGVAVTRAAPEELDTWIDVVATGFAHPDVGDGPESHESFSRETVERAMRDMLEVTGFSCYLARREGRTAGGASMRLDPPRRVAQLTGAATLPAERRHGVQSALLRARLALAAAAGAEIAVITTRPGSKSQENAMKGGFALLYVRGVLLKPAP